MDSFRLRLWGSTQGLPSWCSFMGQDARVEGRAALPCPKSVAARQLLECAEAAGGCWDLAARRRALAGSSRTSAPRRPNTELTGVRARRAAGPHTHTWETHSTHRTHRKFQPTSASAFRMILSAKPREFYFSEELENAKRCFHYEL